MSRQQFLVKADSHGTKLVTFLRDHANGRYSTRDIKDMLERMRCSVNGQVQTYGSFVLQEGDRIEFRPIESREPKAFDPSLILYEDDDLLAYNKPPGLVCDAVQIISYLVEYNPDLVPAHRLDKDTSGVLLLAKGAHVKDKLEKQFQEREVSKTYWAIVLDVPPHKEGEIDNYLGVIREIRGNKERGVVNHKRGKRAITRWKVAAAGKNASLIHCFPQTGRTHQLRIHLADLGHPIIGDHRYGKKRKGIEQSHRQLLHARSLTLSHPITGEKLRIEAPVPSDFQKMMQKLEIKGS